MKRTALYELHKKSGAKMVEFAGWEMPLQYVGLRKEHITVRSSVGIFDVSHMGEIEITGTDSTDFCQYLSSNNLKNIESGQAQYTLLCNKNGGVVDDVIFYKYSDEQYLICVNASNTEKDFVWINKVGRECYFNIEIKDVSPGYAQIAVQGPNSVNLVADLLGEGIKNIKRFNFSKLKWNNINLMIARTGYTGEEGYEIFLDWDKGPELWIELIKSGHDFDVGPCGLGCRDTLRIEAGYPLYGHEIDDTTNPLEAGLGRFVKLDSDDFVGKNRIIESVESGNNRELIAFVVVDTGIPRQGYDILCGEDIIGKVTSGTHSPSLNKPIGMGLVKRNYDKNNLCIDIRNKKRRIELVNIPFYKKNNRS